MKITSRIFALLIVLIIFSHNGISQKTVRTFIFGHSLINHEFQVNPTPSQETSVPHWFHFMSEAADHQYAVSGQYGFLPQHANLPPIAQWGFDFVPGAWNSDNEPFSAADFTNVMITPGNFIQWQGPEINYPNENISPITATQTIISWVQQQEPGVDVFIYENWPDMGPYLQNGFPPSESEWINYNEYLNGEFHQWFLNYYSAIEDSFPNICVRMIPVGPIISALLQKEPYNQIPITSLYEDDAPHGRTTIYFLSAMITYMAMYEEKLPINYQPTNDIDPIITENFKEVIDFIWTKLVENIDENNQQLAFCNATTSTRNLYTPELKLWPNPTSNALKIKTSQPFSYIEFLDNMGKSIANYTEQQINEATFDVSVFTPGIYHLLLRNKTGNLIGYSHFIKGL